MPPGTPRPPRGGAARRGASRRGAPPRPLAALLAGCWACGGAAAPRGRLPFAPAPLGASPRGRAAAAAEPALLAGGARGGAALPRGAVARGASPGDAAAAAAYESWADQFPIAAARRDFYGLDCSRAAVEARFLYLADQMDLSAEEALDIFRPDLWVLCEPSEKIPEKVKALRSLAASSEEVVDFVRAAPRVIGTTTAEEMRGRGLLNMRVRAAVGDGYELLISPFRLLFKAMAKMTAGDITREREAAAKGGSSEADSIDEADRRVKAGEESVRQVLSVVLFGGIFAVLIAGIYVDNTYGGLVHGKGICPASPWAAYSRPDAAGNTGLPCSCAPISRWYLEDAPSAEVYPKLREGRFDTVGGCVWTAEDLARDPSYWDGGRELLYWEKRRLEAKG